MTLNCNWWWGSNFGALRSVESPLCSYFSQIYCDPEWQLFYGSNWKVFMFRIMLNYIITVSLKTVILEFTKLCLIEHKVLQLVKECIALILEMERVLLSLKFCSWNLGFFTGIKNWALTSEENSPGSTSHMLIIFDQNRSVLGMILNCIWS